MHASVCIVIHLRDCFLIKVLQCTDVVGWVTGSHGSPQQFTFGDRPSLKCP